MPESANIFDTEAERYDAWFDSPEGRVLFENELAAIRLLWRDEFRPALEVGVGTGRFAQALGVAFGIDPAAGALRLAERRGIQVKQARGEALPFPDGSFGGVLMIATLCFADDVPALFREAARVLRSDGHLLVGDVPADSPWGRDYQRKKETEHPFYRHAQFFAMDELTKLLREPGLSPVAFSSTLIQSQPEAPRAERPQPGHVADAGFVCLLAQKDRSTTQPS
jgi:SAM-dependent methyltransferase